MTARRGIFVAPFDELSEPALVAELAARAETRGWEGFFVWDHVAYRAPVRAVADPWVTLAAVAVATSSVVLGPLVTPVARRRPPHVARPPAAPAPPPAPPAPRARRRRGRGGGGGGGWWAGGGGGAASARASST